MKKISILLILIVFLFNACNSGRVELEGYIENLGGQVELLVQASNGDTVSVASEMVNDGKISLVASMELPARVWLKMEGEKRISFIIGPKHKVDIEGSMDRLDSVVVKHAELQHQYVLIDAALKERFDRPIEALDKMIENLSKQENCTSFDLENLKLYQNRKMHYIHYRMEFIKKTIELNPESELSLFLLADQLKGDIELQKELFELLHIFNKKSNAYNVLAQKFK